MCPQKVWSSYFQSDHLLGPPQHLHVEEVELPLKVLPQLLQVRWLRPEHLALKIAPQKEIQRVEVGTARGPLNTAVSLRAHCQNTSSKLLRQFSHERRVPMHGCPVLLPPCTIQISWNINVMTEKLINVPTATCVL